MYTAMWLSMAVYKSSEKIDALLLTKSPFSRTNPDLKKQPTKTGRMGQEEGIQVLPDKILLKIFSYLPHKVFSYHPQ